MLCYRDENIVAVNMRRTAGKMKPFIASYSQSQISYVYAYFLHPLV